MARKTYDLRNVRIRTRYIRGGMDLKFIHKNWSDINETQIKRAGMLVRKIMRGSIRRAYRFKKTNLNTGAIAGMISERPSPPGTPPRARTGLKRYVKPGDKKPKSPRGRGFPFKYILSIPFENGTKAVIGHAHLPIKKQDPAKTPMQAHEFGESVRIKTKSLSIAQKLMAKRARTEKQKRAARKKFLSGELAHTRQQQWKTKRIRMPKRPFAMPALRRARNKIGQFWKGCINKGTVRKITKFPRPQGKI